MGAFLRNRIAFRNIEASFLTAVALLALLAAGCRNPDPDSRPPADKQETKSEADAVITPDEALYEQLRSGMFQMGAAAGSIEEALGAAQTSGTTQSQSDRGAFLEVAEVIDSAGAEVVEFAGDPPSKEDIVKAFGAWDEKRLRAVEAGNDAMHDLREASGILADLEESPKEAVSKAAREVRALVLVALDDLWGAIEALGGKPDLEEPIAP